MQMRREWPSNTIGVRPTSPGSPLDRATLIQIRERPYSRCSTWLSWWSDTGRGRSAWRPRGRILPVRGLNVWVFSVDARRSPRGCSSYLLGLEVPLGDGAFDRRARRAMMFGERPRAGRIIAARWSDRAFVLFLLPVPAPDGSSVLLLPLPPGAHAPVVHWSEVILLERDRWWKVIGRSSALGTDRRGELALLALMELGFGAAFAASVWVGGGSLFRALLGERPAGTSPRGSTWPTSGSRRRSGWRPRSLALARFLVYIDQHASAWKAGRSSFASAPSADRWRSPAVVNLLSLGCAIALLAAPADDPDSDPARAVNQALGKAAPTWFDPAKDAVRPVAIPIDPRPKDMSKSLKSASGWGGIAWGTSCRSPRWSRPWRP